MAQKKHGFALPLRVPEETERGDPRTYNIIGAAMAVHRALGPKLLEASYADALATEFEYQKIPFRREVLVALSYRGKPAGFSRRMDFLCYESVVVELKAQSAFVDAHVAQTIHYMECAAIQTGLLLNFGNTSLQFRRLAAGPWNDRPI